ncbi:TetR/AcrR family transcriptional regulator [Acinetobacter qingfengensis]
MAKDTDTYHKLILAAANCFAEKGFNATSVREIAIKAGIAQGTMYVYFKSKDELIKAIVLEEQKSALNEHAKNYDSSHFERLYHLINQCISEVGYPVTHNLWVEIMAQSSRNEELRSTFISSDNIMRKGIATIIGKGIEAGEFNPLIDVNEITLIIFALIDGLICRKAVNVDFSLTKDISSFKSILERLLVIKHIN